MIMFILPFILSFFLLMYLKFSFFSMNSTYYFSGVCFDEFSLFMVYLTCFVIFISYMFSLNYASKNLIIVLFLMLFVCCMVFMTDNILFLYFFYESSLIPILYIIMKWGSYPERSVSSIMLLLYTSIFSFPFLYALLCIYLQSGSFSIPILSMDNNILSLFMSLIIFMTFGVKLPIYGLHFWLPMAHVEAPTFGSMILAGILLKLGGIGLVRFSFFMDISLLKNYLLGYLFMFLVYSTFVCCFQSDFKRLVAYSSVSHMMTIPIMLLTSSFLSCKGLISIMFLHGLSSPLLFMLVGIMYSFFFTRQHVLMRGIICFSPFLAFMLVLSFFFSLSAPPFPSFLAEIMFIISSVNLWYKSVYFIFFFLFLSIVYNLLWLSSVVFLSNGPYVNYSFSLSYSVFYPLVLSLFFIPIVFSQLFFYVF